MQRFYLLFLSLALSLFCTPPTWASGKVANTSNNIAPITGVSDSRPVYQDYASTEPNYLDRRHALVGANCMVNRLGSGLAKVLTGTNNLNNLVDKDLTNYVSTTTGVNAEVAVEPSFAVKDLKKVYKKGTTAGFVISLDNNSLLSLKAIGLPYQIVFYLNGKETERVTCNEKTGGLLNLKLLQVGADSVTTEVTAVSKVSDFDEVALCTTGGLSADVVVNTKIYYAFVGKNGKYYLSTVKESGIDDIRKEYNNNNLVVAQTGGGLIAQKDGQVLIDDNPDNYYILSNHEKTVMVYDQTKTSVSDQFFFPAGSKVGFEYTSSVLDLLKGLTLKIWQYCPGGNTWINGIKYDGQWVDVSPKNNTQFNLLTLDLGLDHKTASLTATQPFNAVEIREGGVAAVNLFNAFVVLPPSIDEDSPLTVSADRSLCDEKDTVTLHSDEAVTWRCTKTPEGAKQPTLTNADDGLSCTVSGFVNEGDYEFTATTKDGRTNTTTVTYGVRPIINTAIRPWVNNFTEKGVSYSADIKAYNDKYGILNASLIPEIRTGSDNLVTPSLDDYASAGGVSLLNHQMLFGVVRSSEATYKEKMTVGFVARTKWKALDLNLLNGLKVKVYNAGAEATTVSSENTHFKVLSAGLINGENYVTTQYSVEIDANTPFDAITLWNNGLLNANLSEMDVYYAFVEPSTLAKKYNDNVAKSWQPITHSTTGASIDASKLSTFGVAKVADAVENLTNIIDDDNTNYATLAGLATVGAGHSVAVKLGRKFEGGHQVKFIVSNEDWLNVELGKFINLKAYLNGNEVATKTNWDVLNLNVIGGENKEAEILWTPTDDDKKPVDFDEISISFNGVANVADVAWIYGIQVANDADGDGIIDATDDESCDNPYLIDENESELNKAHDYVHGKLNLRRYMKPDLATFSKGQWFSICLPVDLTFNQFVKTFGNNAVLAKPMHFIDGHAGTLVFDIDAVYGNNVLLHKDTPYIIKLADQQNFQEIDESLKTELDKNNNNVTAATSKVDSVYIIQGVDYSMTENDKQKTDTILCVHSTPNTGYPSVVWQGTYVARTVLEKGYYTLSNGYITHYNNKGNNKFRGLRCWMYDVNGSSEAKPFDVNIFGNTEDLTTDIRDIEATTAVVNGNIYSIDGQLVRANATSTANLPMGIYIWNHKKIVIK